MEMGQVSPQYTVAVPGDQVIIECYSATSVKWLKNGEYPINATRYLSSLILTNIKKQDGGKYQCSGYQYPGDHNRSKIIAFTAIAVVLVAG